MPTQIEMPRLGITDIDEQHQELFACIDRLEAQIGTGHAYSGALDAATALDEYIRYHFRYEEQFLRRHGYARLDEHIEEHEKISAEFTKLSQQIFNGGDVSQDLLALLRKWVIGHIGIRDREYADILK